MLYYNKWSYQNSALGPSSDIHCETFFSLYLQHELDVWVILAFQSNFIYDTIVIPDEA